VNPPVIGTDLEPQARLPKKTARREDVKLAAGMIAISLFVTTG
jgi:hypothetical protein